MTTWVVVADSRRARIFEADGPGAEHLEEIHTLLHPRDYRHADGDGDTRRRVFESATSARHAAEPRTLPREREANAFAREIARFLLRECENHAFGDLVLVAEPHFMGELRNALDPRLTARVARRRSKDLVALPAAEIGRQLQRGLV